MLDLKYDHYLPVNILHYGCEFCGPNEHHSHSTWDCYLIHIVLSGKGTLYFNQKVYPMKEHQAFFLFPGDVAAHISDKDAPWSYAWIGFSGTEAFSLAHLLDLNRDYPIYSINNLAYANLLIHEILSVNIHQRQGYLLAIGNLLKIASMMENEKNTIKNVDRFAYEHLSKACNYINENIKQTITIPQIASYVGVCRSHLYRIFKSTLGISISDYITNKRINMAIELFDQGETDLLSIAYSCGFLDVESMRRSFKKITGKPPREYINTRRLHQ